MGPPPPLGALRVFVQHGTGLPPADLNGLADPYVKLTIRHMTRETRVVHECLNPVWDELVQFIGPIEDFRGSELVLRVCDRDVLKHDDAMGGCRVNLRELSMGETLDFVEGLSTQGGLTFRVSWEAVAPYELRPGKMHVQVCCATDLLAADSNGLSDPYCKLTWLGQNSMVKVQSWRRPSSAPAPPQGAPGSSGRCALSGGRSRLTGCPDTASSARAIRLQSRRFHRLWPFRQKGRTKIVPKSLNPEWDESFIFAGVLHELLSCPLRLRLYDHDRLSRLGLG